MPTPLLSTKFFIPKMRPGGILRPRLSNRLLESAKRPASLALISCPAGFGKTTLLSEFVQALGAPVAWVALDEADNDPVRFWTALLSALQGVRPGLGASTLGLLELPGAVPDETIPALLINELADIQDELVLVLDDLQSIHEAAIHSALAFLLEHLPERLHLVVSTRMDPPWPLARLRARNQLVELRSADLRFTPEETAVFLKDSMRLELSPEDAAALEKRTEGWAASLQLAGLSMQGRTDLHDFVRSFTGSHAFVAEYLVEEVLKSQPQELQAFLLQTSILERMNAELCRAVTGDEQATAALALLQHRNLFVVSLDDEGRWVRYHHLFADLLQARLRHSMPAEAVAQLQRRAARWYWEAGMEDEAIAHALAAPDYALALELVEQAALPMILQAYVRTVQAWMAAIPIEYAARSPRANLAFAWMYLLRNALAEAAPYLERLETWFAMAPSGEQTAVLQGEWLAVQARLKVGQGQAEASRRLAEQALELLPEREASVRCMAYASLAMACQVMLDYDRAAQAFGMIVKEARQAGNFGIETLGISGRVQMLLQLGQLHSAARIAREGIQRLEPSGRMPPFGATLYGELGQIHYYWHELDEARPWFVRSAHHSGRSGYSDSEVFQHIVLSRMAHMQGDWTEARRELEEACRLADAIPPAIVREELLAQQVVVQVACGQLAEAEAILKPEGFSFDGDFSFPPLAPGTAVTQPLGLIYNSALRVLLAGARAKSEGAALVQGLAMAEQVLAGELACLHRPIAMQTLLLRSQLYGLIGEQRLALEDMAQAVELGRPEGFISPFVEEGPAAAKGLRKLLGSGQLEPEAHAYVESILAAFPAGSAPVPARAADHDEEGPVEPLTARELEVLGLIAVGDSNQDIARKLVITVSAVKKHTVNIFHKLNVNSRTQALARARQLGLLAPGR